MSITLSASLEAVIREKADSGPYADVEDVLTRALTLLEEQEDFERLRQLLVEADAAIERGEGAEWSTELIGRIRATGNDQFRLGTMLNPDVNRPPCRA